jgi:hypothetical protein
MADLKISELTDGNPTEAGDYLPVSRVSGAATVTRRVSVGSILTNTTTSTLVLGDNKIVLGDLGVRGVKSLVSLGTVTTLLHGNVSGPPTWGPVDLANDTTGNLSVARLNAGTGATAQTCWTGNATWKIPSLVSVALYGAVSDGSDEAVIVEAALAARKTVYLPPGTRFVPTGTTPTGSKIIGGDSTTVIDATATYFNIGGLSTVENVTIKDTNEPSGSFVPLWINRTPVSATVTPVNHGGIMVWKGGYTGDSNTGIACTHSGIGGGDNFYAQTTTDATAYDQALYRGDLYGTGAGGAMCFYGIVFGTADGGTSADGSLGLVIKDVRTGAGADGVVLFHTDTRADSDPMVTIKHSGSTYTGSLLSLRSQDGSGSYNARQLAIKSGSSAAGLQLWSSGGSGHAYALVSNTDGSLTVQPEDFSGVVLRLTAAGQVQFESGGVTRRLDFTDGFWKIP